MRPSTVLAAVSTLLLTLPTAKAQDSCVSGITASIRANDTVKNMPFTATVKETFDQKLADGNAIHGTVRYHIARDASGRTMTEMPSCSIGDDGHRHQTFSVEISDRAANTRESWILTDRKLKVATIMHMGTPQKPSEAEMALILADSKARRAATATQNQPEKLGLRDFQGISADGTRRTETIPAGEEGNALPLISIYETWYSRKLGVGTLIINDNPRYGHTVAELEELHQGDPDPSLFSPPKDYIIKDQPASQPTTIISMPNTTP